MSFACASGSKNIEQTLYLLANLYTYNAREHENNSSNKSMHTHYPSAPCGDYHWQAAEGVLRVRWSGEYPVS